MEKQQQWENELKIIEANNKSFFESKPGYLYENDHNLDDYVNLQFIENKQILGFIKDHPLPDNIITEITSAYNRVWEAYHQ